MSVIHKSTGHFVGEHWVRGPHVCGEPGNISSADWSAVTCEHCLAYKANGYSSRTDYLKGIAEDYGVPLELVTVLAKTLGPNEDFDGLITALEDYEDDEDFT